MNFQNLKNLLSRHLSLVLTAATFIIFAVMAIGFAAADAACAPEELNVISEQVTSLNAILPMPYYSENGSDGSTIYAVSIEDIGTVNTVTAFNYADEIYTETGGYVVNTGTGRTKTGTIKILLKNLDPTDEDFEEKAASLDRFSDGLYWKVTLYIPAVFSSCNIYVNYALTEQIGSIEGYDFSYFSEKELVSETHTDGTSPSLITLSLKNDREKLTGDSVTDGCVVTIHYESSCAISGILGNVLIGEESAVKTAVSNNSTIHFPIAAAGILVFAFFIFICILKRTASFMPPLLLSFGIFLYHSCRYALT
ncbi:MAG: hypothetical protein LUD27_09325, partial [Clostridia bacterium]|nr:hypothetical protein [Clostridia bacterium]